ncbi:MAG: hypothetical protein ACLPWF_25285 [Bryobacteraceae bacterium]
MILLCLAAIWLAGFGLVRWMFPRPLGWSLHNVLLLSLAIGTGAGIASCVYFLALLLAGPNVTVLASALGAAVVCALALGLLTKRRGTQFDSAEGPPVPGYLIAFFVLAAALAVIMFLGTVAYTPHGEEGAWSIWNLRARFLVRSGPFWRTAFSRDLAWTHPDYPLLLPGLVALCWKLAAQESTAAPIAIAFLFALGTAGVLTSTLAVLRGKTQALIAGTLLLGSASFIALSAALYGDVPLSFYILSSLALLCLQDRHPEDLRFSVLAGLLAGFAAWTRNEGVIFVVALLIGRAFALFRWRERAAIVPQFLRLLAGLAAPIAVVVIFKLRVAPPGELISMPASTILKNLADPGRWITTLEGLVFVLISFGRFLIPIVLLLALYAYLVRLKVDSRDRASLATAVIALPLTLATQLLVDILSVPYLPLEITTSFERFLLQLWPAALLIFFLASGPLELLAPAAARKGKVPARAAKPKAARSPRSVAETR